MSGHGLFATVLLLSTLCSTTGAQTPLMILPGDSTGDRSGFSVSGAGDVDGDGRGDLVVGAPDDDNNGASSGSVRLFSGTGATLRTLDGAAAGQRFGVSVSGAGDVDRDGFADVVIGTEAGYARVVSGRDGSTLHTFTDAALPNLGRSVRGAGDVNGDGYDDVLIGAPTNGVVVGAVRCYSGKDGSTLHTFLATGTERTFDGAGDTNGDGYADIVIGDSLHNGTLFWQGKAEVRSGLDGSVLRTVEGALGLEQLGATVAPAGDVDADGFDDFLAVSMSAGVKVFSGQTGALLRTLTGERAGDSFGASARGIGDVNGDGRSDLLVGAPSTFLYGPYARLFSGADGSLLRSFRVTGPLSGFGTSVGGADIDADGFPEPIIGAPDHTHLGLQAGSTFLYDVASLAGFASARVTQGGAGDRLGTAVAGVGDVDQDGRGDIVVGVPLDDTNGADAGKAVVVSGADGTVLRTFLGDGAGDRFGTAAAAAGDVDKDGVGDIVVGAPFDDNNGADCGSVSVLSGRTGLPLYTFHGDSAGDQMGAAVAGVGDVNRDGFVDIAAGAPFDDDNGADCGSVRVFSGKDGATLYTFFGDGAGDRLGTAVAGPGDVDGDGYADVLTGAPFDDNNGADSGSARLFSGRTGSTLFTLNGDSAGDAFGSAVAGPGDVDGDGRGDLLVGAPLDDDAGTDAGRARLFSGASGMPLRTLDGAAAQDRFGAAVAFLGDADGDGRPDLLVGAPQDPLGSTPGRVRIVSGATGATLQTLTGVAGTRFGSTVGGVTDTNADGFADVAVGAPLATSGAGAATLFASVTRTDPGSAQRFGPACPGSDGRLPRIGLTGRPLVGTTFAITLYAAPPSAPAALHVDVARQNIDLALIGFPDCILLALPFLSVATSTDASGRRSLVVGVPAGYTSMVGARLHAQWITAEIAQNRIPVSNGLTITFGSQ